MPLPHNPHFKQLYRYRVDTYLYLLIFNYFVTIAYSSRTIKVYESFVLGKCKCNCTNNMKLRTEQGYLQTWVTAWHRKGENHPSWKGGRQFTSHGYVKIWCPDNVNADNDGYVYEHILEMQKKIHRGLRKNENVHHKNKIKDMNVLWNLELVTIKEHRKFHKRKGRKDLSDRFIEEFAVLWKWLYGRSQSQEDYYNNLKTKNINRNIKGQFQAVKLI